MGEWPTAFIRRMEHIILCLKRADVLRTEYVTICNVISEYGRMDSDKEARVLWVKENCDVVIGTNAIRKVKKSMH